MSHGQTVTAVSVVCEVTLLCMSTPPTVPHQYSWLPNVTRPDSDSSVCGVWSDIVVYVYPPDSATPVQLAS